jgi:aryl-alcohol dehydrogenase-like predicted oxidoreductase
MEYVRLGATGLKISRLALGCMSYGDPGDDPTVRGTHPWALPEDKATPFFRQATELGITFWDTANVYQAGASEEITGRAIREYSRREDIVLATKVRGKMHDGPGGEGLSRKAVLEQVDASLTRLGTDYIDLYQIHRFDDATPVEETMEALHDIVKAGKVRYLGASSMYAWQFAKLQHAADLGGWTRFVSMQNQYNLLRRQDEPELMAMCGDMGVGLVPYSPNGKGRLARPAGEQSTRSTTDHVVQSFDSPHDEPVINAVQHLAQARGVTMAQVALAWVLRNPLVCAPVVGATKPHHLQQAVDALDLSLSDEEAAKLEAPYVNAGPSWF